jgi:L-seryl-tRNA(Ser) seleniumtransferase
MSSAADPARDTRTELLRKIPSVDQLLALPALAELATRVSRNLVADAARAVLQRIRDDVSRNLASALPETLAIGVEVADDVAQLLTPSLRPVINATGVILHTNLGRAPVAQVKLV